MNTMFRNFHILIIVISGVTFSLQGSEGIHPPKSIKKKKGTPVAVQKEFDIIDRIEKNSQHISWEDVLDLDGIKVKRKKLGNKSIFALKATGVLKAPLESIITIFRDTKNAHLWAPGLKQRTLLKNISELEAVVYDIHEMPWPCQDRDVVIYNTIKIFPLRKQIGLISSSIENFKLDPKPTDKVRAELHYSFIGLTPITKEKTYVEFFIHVDPRGSLPKWIVNLIVKTRPHAFLKAIEKAAQKTKNNLGKRTLKLVDQLKSIISNSDTLSGSL